MTEYESTPTLTQVIRDVLGSLALEHAAIATRVLDLVLHRDDAEEILLPVVLDEVRRVHRLTVRASEEEAFADTSSDTATEAAVVQTTALRGSLLGRTVFVPERGLVPWGKATVDDHRARIDYLEAKIGGLKRTIGRHEAAIRIITAAGVTCLAEVDNFEPSMLAA